MAKIKIIVVALLIVLETSLLLCLSACNIKPITPKEYNTTPFLNPIAEFSVADPFIVYDSKTKFYYGLYTQGDRLEIFRHKHVSKLFSQGEAKLIFTPDGSKGIWGDIWAPDMHRAKDGRWYVYASGRITQEPGEKRIFGLASKTADPFGEWEFIGLPAGDVFSIDPTVVYAPNRKRYMCYSRVDHVYGQVLDIALLTKDGKCENAQTIARAELDWELVSPYVGTSAILEGPFFIQNDGRIFLIYSANGCWSNYYALGVLEYIGGAFNSPDSWKKHPEPLLTFGNGVYGPGHASFFYSPDKTELWCVYHGMAKSNENSTPAYRYCHLQKVEFDNTGYPVMGNPVGTTTPILPPSGEEK